MNQAPLSPDRPPAVRIAGDLGAALVAAGLCYSISCLIVAQDAVTVGFGKQWERMSEAPFELRGQLPHRILGPVLAYCLGFGGDRWLPFVRGLAVLLLATVFFFARRRGARPIDALLVTLAVAVTAPIQMFKQNWVGYADPLCYLLFFWMWLAAGRPILFWGLFLANLLTHELAVFLLPWAWFVRRGANGSSRTDVIGAGLALGLYGAFYLWVKSAAPEQKYYAGYFFDNPMFPGGTFVIIAMAITHLVVAFGPILAVLAWHQHARPRDRERAHLWLVGGAILAIFCIAWDWTRHANLIVLPLVLASLRFLDAGHRLLYTGIVGLGVGLMAWIPPWSSHAWPTSAMANIPLLFESGAARRNEATGEPMGGTLSDVLTKWLPAVAPVLVPILAILPAIWFAGAWFGRRQAAAAADPAAQPSPRSSAP